MPRNPILRLQTNESVDAQLVYDEGLYQDPRPPYNNVQYMWTLNVDGQDHVFFASEMANEQLLNFRQGDLVNIFKGQRGFEITAPDGSTPMDAGHQPQQQQRQPQRQQRPPQQRQPQQRQQGPQRGRQQAGGTPQVTMNSLTEFSNAMGAYMRALKIAKFLQLKFELDDFSLNAAAFTIAQMAKSTGFDLVNDPIDNWLPVLSDDVAGGDNGLFQGLSLNERQVLEAHFGKPIPDNSGNGRDEVRQADVEEFPEDPPWDGQEDEQAA